jgi:hypothetical protein
MDALVGTIVGGVLAIIGGILAKSFDEWRARKSLRAAFRAEIASIVELMNIRGHEKLFEATLEHWRRQATGSPVLIGPLTKPMDPVFSKNSDKVGLLGRDVAGQVVRFYAIMDGLRDDIKSLADNELDRFSQHTKVRLMEEDLRLWGEAKTMADRLTRML